MKKLIIIMLMLFLSGIMVSAGNGDMVYYNRYNNQARLVNLSKRTYQEWEKRNNKWYVKRRFSIRKIYNVKGKLQYYTSFKKLSLNGGGGVYFTSDWKYFIGSSWDPSRTKVSYLWPRRK